MPTFLTPEELNEITPYDKKDCYESVKVKCAKEDSLIFMDAYNKNLNFKDLIVNVKLGKAFIVDEIEYNYLYFRTPTFYAKRIKNEEKRKIEDQRSEERKNKGILQLSGKSQINGTIVKTIIRTIDGITERKCIIELENKATLYGTLPAKVKDDYCGKISFFAKVSASEKDEIHGFYSRPSKIILNE